MLHPPLAANVATHLAAAQQLAPHQTARLLPLVQALQQHAGVGMPSLLFVCTHNSRRSHLAQLWALALAHHLGLHQLQAHSAGTEATAVFPATVGALRAAGFQAVKTGTGKNPPYQISWADDAPPALATSKTLAQATPNLGPFVAVMVCTEADEACPHVPGAQARVPLPYPDPKQADGQPNAAQAYANTSNTIAQDLAWALQQLR